LTVSGARRIEGSAIKTSLNVFEFLGAFFFYSGSKEKIYVAMFKGFDSIRRHIMVLFSEESD
jgi:hypothetical protein